jgi:hypothetical protein
LSLSIPGIVALHGPLVSCIAHSTLLILIVPYVRTSMPEPRKLT